MGKKISVKGKKVWTSEAYFCLSNSRPVISLYFAASQEEVFGGLCLPAYHMEHPTADAQL